MSDRMDELDAITAVMQMYVDGAAKADVGRLKEAFHESARMSLIKIDGTWKIVTKLFAVTGQTPTGEA